jgi:tetratricopeptide (TPR) repeat protein
MSFTLELAASWARSPVRAVRNRRRLMQKSADEESSNRSPTRAMDFPVDEDIVDELMDDEGEAETAFNRNEHSSIVRQLSFAPYDVDAPQEVTPIPLFQRQRNLKVKTLPTLSEDKKVEAFSPTNITTLIKIKKKTYLPKPSRLEKVQEHVKDAEGLAGTGDEDEAIKIYEKAIRAAESELSKLKGMLRKSIDKHPSAVPSIQTRIQQDMLDLVLISGKTKTDMINLYERQGDYDSAIEICKEMKNLYKKQKKRSPLPGQVRSDLYEKDSLPYNTDVVSVNSGSISKDSKSRGSKISGDSDQSIIWYVDCPNIDFLIRSTSILYTRLTKAKSSYDDRKKLTEEILMLRQEITTTTDARERELLYSKCEMMTMNAVDIERSCLGDMHPQVADTLQLLSAIYLEQQNTKPGYRDKAIQYMLQGLEINMKLLGEKHPRTGHDMLRMARLYQQPGTSGSGANAPIIRKDEDRAIEYFRQAAAIFRGVKCGHKIVGSILNDLSVIYVSRREFHTAINLLQEALNTYEDDADEISTTSFDEGSYSVNNICIEIVQVWRNIGECHMQLRDFQKAIEAYINALDVQRDARQKYDSVSDSDDLDSVSEEKSYQCHLMRMINDESIADTLRRLGKALAASGKLQEALVVYRESVQIYRASVQEALNFAKFGSNPELPGKQDQLASTLFCIAELYTMAGNSDEAVRVFNESMQLRISSDKNRLASQRCNMVHCAMCLVGIANVHCQKGEHVEAHKLYNDALYFCEAQGRVIVVALRMIPSLMI